MLLMEDSFGVRNAFISLLLLLDRIVYSFVNYIYQVFIYLADFTIFNSDDFRSLANRMYIIVGVVALFLIAFSLLQSLVNPDEISKGKNSPIKVVKNILISIVLLGVVPPIFNFAYEAQNKIINGQVIQNIILNGNTMGATRINCSTGEIEGTEDLNGKDGLKKVGNIMAVTVFSSFFTGNEDDFYGVHIMSEDDSVYSLCQAYEDAKTTGDFTVFDKFIENTSSDASPENKVNYSMGISTICGGITFYLLLTFSIGLAVRAIKLAYYQLVSPIPILARVVPQGQKIFDNWLKGTLSTFAEVFIRLLVIFFAIFMIQVSVGRIDEILFGGPDASFWVLLLAKALIIIGFLIFAKKAPEFITDMVGIKSGSLKLGIKDQIREAALIGKPIATTMDKAQGFITSGAGAGWSYMKGTLTGRARPAGSLGNAMFNGAVNGLIKGGNQFAAGRDNEFKLETGKDGADSFWGGVERWATNNSKTANNNARQAYSNIIADAENSDEFQTMLSEAIEAALSAPQIVSQREAAINKAKDDFLNNQKNDYVEKQFAQQKAQNDDIIDTLKNSDDYLAIRRQLGAQYSANYLPTEGEDFEKAVLQQYSSSKASESEKTAIDNYLQGYANIKQELAEQWDATQKASAADIFDKTMAEDAGKLFDKEYLENNVELTSSIHKQVEDKFKADPKNEIYKQAKNVISDWERTERQKDFKAVVEKMMKDEKAKGGGTTPPKDDNKK